MAPKLGGRKQRKRLDDAMIPTEENHVNSATSMLGPDSIKFIAAVVCTAVAAVIASGVSDSQRIAGLNPALIVIFLFAGVFVAISALSEKTMPTEKRDAYNGLSPSKVYIGEVKRFSVKNGWGLIALHQEGELAHSPSDDREQRKKQNVRFYQDDQAALGLKLGDWIDFRVGTDKESAGWCRALNIRRCDPPATFVAEDSADAEGDQDVCADDSPKLPEADISSTCTTQQSGAEDDSTPRPETTNVVARRLIHAHLDVKLSEEHRTEERSFWEKSGSRNGSRRTSPKAECAEKDLLETANDHMEE